MNTGTTRFETVDFSRVAEELAMRRTELAGELERLTAPPEQGAGIGFGKRVGDGTTEAVERIATTATARSLAATIREIDGAILQIEKGTYGVCVACGDVIPESRLIARPVSVTCVDCAG